VAKARRFLMPHFPTPRFTIRLGLKGEAKGRIAGRDHSLNCAEIQCSEAGGFRLNVSVMANGIADG
jgi:hypothetical protein